MTVVLLVACAVALTLCARSILRIRRAARRDGFPR